MPLELPQPLVLLLEEILCYSVPLLQQSSAHVLQQRRKPHVREQPLVAPALAFSGAAEKHQEQEETLTYAGGDADVCRVGHKKLMRVQCARSEDVRVYTGMEDQQCNHVFDWVASSSWSNI